MGPKWPDAPRSRSAPTPSSFSSHCSKPGSAGTCPDRSSPVSGFSATTALALAPPADVPTAIRWASASVTPSSDAVRPERALLTATTSSDSSIAVALRVRGPRTGWSSRAPTPRVPRYASRSSAVIRPGATPSFARYAVVRALPKSSGNASATIDGRRWYVPGGSVGKTKSRAGPVVGIMCIKQQSSSST